MMVRIIFCQSESKGITFISSLPEANPFLSHSRFAGAQDGLRPIRHCNLLKMSNVVAHGLEAENECLAISSLYDPAQSIPVSQPRVP